MGSSPVGRNQPCPCGSGKKHKLCCGRAIQPLQLSARPAGPTVELVVLLPTRGTVSVETHQSMLANMSGVTRVFLSAARRPVDEARNYLARGAIDAQHHFSAKYALWVDDDAAWRPGVVERMLNFLKAHQECDLLAGWCSTRAPYSPPLAWRSRADLSSFPRLGQDCAMGQVVEVERVAFHFAMHRIDLLKRLGENPFTLPAGSDVGEDVAFCDRVRALGGRIFVDTGAWIPHIEVSTGDAYLPGSPKLFLDDAGELHNSEGGGVLHDYGERVNIVRDAAEARAGELTGARAYADPERRRQAKAEAARRRRQRKKRATILGSVDPSGVDPSAPSSLLEPLLAAGQTFRSAADARGVLERAIRLIDGDNAARPIEKARAAALLVGTALRACDAADLEARIAAIERRHLSLVR